MSNVTYRMVEAGPVAWLYRGNLHATDPSGWCIGCPTPLYAVPPQRPAEPVQEPVAKVELMTTGGNAGLATRIVEIDDHLRERLRPGQLLYTAPPQRKPLTEEQIVDAVRQADLDWQAGWTLDEHEPNRLATLVRVVEQAHGIGGKE